MIGVLASGGLDSAILISHLLDQGERVQPFYIRSNLYWEAAELAGLQAYLAAIATDNLLPLVQLQLPLDDLYAGHWSISGNRTPDADHSRRCRLFARAKSAFDHQGRVVVPIAWH